MEKIKQYKLKPDITKEQLISMGFKEGGTYVHKEAKMVLIHCIVIHNTTEIKKKNGKIRTYKFTSEFDVDIAITDNLNDWNDYDNILVLDSDFGQPYYPFYEYMSGKMKANQVPKVLPLLVTEYNKYMDSLEFLEEVK